MIHPVPGMAFIIEDKQDVMEGAAKLKEMGFSQSEAHERNVGVSGVIYAVNESVKCSSCGAKQGKVGFKKGHRVLYSKFIAEQIICKDDEGKDIERLRSVPVDGILAIISPDV